MGAPAWSPSLPGNEPGMLPGMLGSRRLLQIKQIKEIKVIKRFPVVALLGWVRANQAHRPSSITGWEEHPEGSAWGSFYLRGGSSICHTFPTHQGARKLGPCFLKHFKSVILPNLGGFVLRQGLSFPCSIPRDPSRDLQ